MPALRNDYTTNALNQYVSRENNTIAVSGTAAEDPGGAGGTGVAIGGRNVAAGRQGRYWNDEVVVSNSVAPWRGPLSIYAAKRGSGAGPDLFRTELRTAEIAAASETITYDLDGNPTADGIYTYTWDAENRLTKMEVSSTARANGFPYRIYEFKYDYMGRRVEKRVLDATTLPSVEISHRRFLYDGWSMLAEYSLTAGSPTLTVLRSYTWGLDIARSLSDAGGVGALLQIADHASRKSYLPSYDGNGNVASLLNGDSGALAAVYEYNGFGENLRVQSFDTVVADNPYRFSTKFTDTETGLVDYGRRFYDSKNGRFVGRDPIEETGGLNLYGFVGNNGVNRWDVLGMYEGTIYENEDNMSSVQVVQAPEYIPGPYVAPTWVWAPFYDASDGIFIDPRPAPGLPDYMSLGDQMMNDHTAFLGGGMSGLSILGRDEAGNYIVAAYSNEAQTALNNAMQSWEGATGRTALVGTGNIQAGGTVSLGYFNVGAGPVTPAPSSGVGVVINTTPAAPAASAIVVSNTNQSSVINVYSTPSAFGIPGGHHLYIADPTRPDIAPSGRHGSYQSGGSNGIDTGGTGGRLLIRSAETAIFWLGQLHFRPE